MLPVEGLGQPLHYFETLGSTNDLAKELAASGASHGTLVVADEQTAGRGRGDRKWLTSKGGGLALSLVLRPEEAEIATASGVGCMTALAICDALQEEGIKAQIKWPNDVLIAERKVAGVLVEAAWHGMELAWTVVGVGINVRSESTPPIEQIEYPATSVDAEVGHKVDRVLFLRTLLKYFAERWIHLGSDVIARTIDERLAFRGQEIELVGAGKALRGRLQGVRPNGQLRLLTAKGEMDIAAGETRLRPITTSP
ncbi:MAG: biotin--[acetyl-CoA-carboxylase] ligase [Anaerolineales bacterium]|jgi:BirA family biotin operon repressor/biotin-[acetyl-CoA-carboxylase] ligase